MNPGFWSDLGRAAGEGMWKIKDEMYRRAFGMIEDHPFIRDLETLIERKNASYGDSIGKSAEVLRIISPSGVPASIYHRAHILIRIIDKVCRLFSPTIGREDAIDAWKDIAGYAWKAIQLEEEHDFED